MFIVGPNLTKSIVALLLPYRYDYVYKHSVILYYYIKLKRIESNNRNNIIVPTTPGTEPRPVKTLNGYRHRTKHLLLLFPQNAFHVLGEKKIARSDSQCAGLYYYDENRFV